MNGPLSFQSIRSCPARYASSSLDTMRFSGIVIFPVEWLNAMSEYANNESLINELQSEAQRLVGLDAKVLIDTETSLRLDAPSADVNLVKPLAQVYEANEEILEKKRE